MVQPYGSVSMREVLSLVEAMQLPKALVIGSLTTSLPYENDKQRNTERRTIDLLPCFSSDVNNDNPLSGTNERTKV
jgi:hypothetical protein